MDTNDYVLELLVRDRLGRARAEAAQHALVRRLPRGRPLRVRLGIALVALGHRLLAGAAPPVHGASAAQ